MGADHTDGTVTPIYYRQQGASWSASWNEGQTNLSAAEQVQSPSSNPQQNNTTYYIGDQIGSARMLTASGGYPVSVDTFYPFGFEMTPPPNDNTMKFTGKERDAESALDYFGARHYSSTLGRFISPDYADDDPEPVPYGDFENPQSLNLYSYVRNNPLTGTDPDGHAGCNSDGLTSVVTMTSRDLAPGFTASFSIQPPCDKSAPGFVSQVSDAASRAFNTAQQTVSAFQQWASASRDSTCMNFAIGAGTAIGTAQGIDWGSAVGGAGGFAAAAPSGELAGVVTVPVGTAVGAGVGGLIGGKIGALAGGGVGWAMCAQGSGGSGGSGGGGGGSRLSNAARRKLGNLANRAGETVRDVIRSRGGTASNAKEAGQWADRTLGEAAEAAARGDSSAETAVKIAKQAGRLGQQY